MILRESESYSTQMWIGVGLIGGVMIIMGLLSPKHHQGRDPMGDQALSYNYEMPRVETEDMPFDLSDREVDRRTRELEALAKKKKEAAKMADLKKAKTAAEIAKKVAEAKAKAKAAEAARRAQMKVTSVSASDRYKMQSGLDGSGSGSGYSAPDQYAAAFGHSNNAKNSGGKDEATDDVEELTSAQWRALLTADPSGTNITKFIRAKAAGKVDDATVIEVVRDLIKDAGEDRQKAGLTIMSALPSAGMFEFLVKEKASFASDVQAKVDAEIAGYSGATKLSYLGPVVATVTDSMVLAEALEQISTAVELYKKNQNGTVSGSAGSVATLGQLQSFLNSLKIVGSGEDGSVAQIAQSLTQNIQGLSSTSNVASTNKPRRGRNTVAYSNE